MARTVRAQAVVAAEAAAGKVSLLHKRTWLNPENSDATPTLPAIKANTRKNPVAAFPIGK